MAYENEHVVLWNYEMGTSVKIIRLWAAYNQINDPLSLAKFISKRLRGIRYGHWIHHDCGSSSVDHAC